MNDRTKNLLVTLVAVLAGLAVISHLPARETCHVEHGAGWQSEEGKELFEVQDAGGQVYTLERVRWDRNLFVVWQNAGETNLNSSTWNKVKGAWKL